MRAMDIVLDNVPCTSVTWRYRCSCARAIFLFVGYPINKSRALGLYQLYVYQSCIPPIPKSDEPFII